MEPVSLSPGIGDSRPTATLYYGQDVRETLRTLPEASVHTVCTSPPYFGLRDYGTGDKQIGLEDSPEEFVAALVDVFRDVRRVLRDDGTLWLNLGDSYASSTKGSGGTGKSTLGAASGGNGISAEGIARSQARQSMAPRKMTCGIADKNLLGIPWRVALALQADGWYLRQDIIWAKPNPMPESVTDRCTKAHEYVFLFAHPDSGGRYYYDNEAVREPVKAGNTGVLRIPQQDKYALTSTKVDPTLSRVDRYDTIKGANRRSVWNVNVAPYSGSHFATWPPELVRPMVLAGCPAGGTVLDPFSGSGTTGMVALQEGRNYVGIDLNPDYLPLAMNRVQELPAPSNASDEERGDAFDLFSGG
jgi:DNA modification methylase